MDFVLNDSPELAAFIEHPVVRNNLDHPLTSVRLVSPTGQYHYASSGVRQLLGYDATEFVKIDAWTLVHPDDGAMLREVGAALASGAGVKTTVRARMKDGNYRWVETRMSPFMGLIGVLVEPAETTPDAANWEPIAPLF